jgi:VanZ family protein
VSAERRASSIVLSWLPACLYMGLIWALSSVALPIDLNSGFSYTDKIVHFLEFAVLGLLVAHAVLRTFPDQTTARGFTIAVVITVAWSLLDELHQVYVPGRDADMLDLVADTLGALAGAAVRAGLETRGRSSSCRHSQGMASHAGDPAAGE